MRLAGRGAVVFADAESEPDRVTVAKRVAVTFAHRDGRRLHQLRARLSHRLGRAMEKVVVSLLRSTDATPLG